MPEGAIVVGRGEHRRAVRAVRTAGAPRHDWLTLTGGAIGQGLPVATGAAVACPDRKVIALEADGSAMYTLQSLWTQAREGLDVTTVIFDNGSYAILNLELSRVGADPGPVRCRCSTCRARPSTSSRWRRASVFPRPAPRPRTTSRCNSNARSPSPARISSTPCSPRDSRNAGGSTWPKRFNHMELTVPRGYLDDDTRRDIAAFYGEMFDWRGVDVELFNQRNFLLAAPDGSQHFILLAEADKFMQAPGYDHLGILCDSREEVDDLLERAKRWREKDDRVRITEFKADLVQGAVTVHAFYVRYLLPIQFDVQVIEYAPGSEPDQRWSYS